MEGIRESSAQSKEITVTLIDSAHAQRLIEKFNLTLLRSMALFVEYEGHPDELRKAGCAVFSAESNRIEAATVISPITDKSLRTSELFSCACIVAVGATKMDPTKNVAVLAHIYNVHLFRKNEQDVRDEITKRLKDLRDICIPDSLRVVVAGGQTGTPVLGSKPEGSIREQTDEVLTSIIFNGIGPVKISWLRNNTSPSESQEVILKTETRELYTLTTK